MKEIYATLLLHSAGQPITIENLTKLFQAIGIIPDEGKLKALVTSLEGQDIDKLIQEAAFTIAAPVEKKEEKKKEEAEEKKTEEAVAGQLTLLFGS